MTKEERFEACSMYHSLVQEICDILECIGQEDEDGNGGFWIRGNYWLTPRTCGKLANLIEEHNNTYFIQWEVDRDAVAKLRKASKEAE